MTETDTAALRDDQETVLRDVLRAHYLAEVVRGRGRDNPVCACSLVHLGWHPSVGDAVGAWVDHVLAQARRTASRRSLRAAAAELAGPGGIGGGNG